MDALQDLTGVILVGGLGTRLRSVVVDRPKVLAQVGGRPFLAYLLDQIAAAGVRDVVLCTGYLGEQIRNLFGDTFRNVQLVYSQENRPLGTGGALRLALSLIETDTVLVMNGDSFCQTEIKNFWNWHRAVNASASLFLVQVPAPQRYGQVQTDQDGRVLNFVEKGEIDREGWISAGVYIVNRQLLETIAPNQVVSLERDVFPAWIGKRLYGYHSQGRFIDIGTPEDYANAEQFFTQPGSSV